MVQKNEATVEAPLLYIINFSKLRFRVKNETTLIFAKNRVDLSSISEVRSYITEWPPFFGPPGIYAFGTFRHYVMYIRYAWVLYGIEVESK